MPYLDLAHDALSIVLSLHRGHLQSFEHDKRKRILRGHAMIEATDDLNDPYYNTLWRTTRGRPTFEDFAQCERAVLPRIQATLERFLRLVPSYVATPLRVIPGDACAAGDTLGVFRDEIDIRMDLHGLDTPCFLKLP